MKTIRDLFCYLYHGTKKEYLPNILREGLKRGKNGGDSVYIYACKTKQEAKRWGKVILKIDATGMDLRYFSGESPLWQILIKNDVGKNKITLMK